MAGKRGTAPGGEPGLSGEDAALWKHVTQDAKPLKKREPAQRAPAPEAPERAPEAKPKTPDRAKPARPEVVVKPSRPKPPPPKPPVPELDHGGVAGVDRRSVARMKRGQMRIEARLDLHGHTQSEAHGELAAFLADAQARGKRCVLVITGKGVTKEGGGVLRASTPRWLNEPANRGRVLAFDYAQPKHGGHGALYVLLRRKR